MSVNLIEMARNYVTPAVLEKMGEATGIQPEQAQKVMTTAIPTVLAGVLQDVSSESGGNRLLELTKQKIFDGSLLNNLDNALSGDRVNNLVETGKGFLSNLFGGKLDQIADLLGRTSGAGKSTAMTVLAAAGPIVMNLIGKLRNEQGLSAGGLRELLMSQKDAIAKLAPPGLANVLGLSSLANLGNVGDQVKQRIGGATDELAGSAQSMYGSGQRGAPRAADQPYSGAMKAGLIGLACILALAALWWWRAQERPMVETPPPAPVDMAAVPPPNPPLEGQPIANLVFTTLPSGRGLQLEPDSTALRIVEFLKITPADRPAERFVLREGEFNPDEAASAARSTSTIEHLAQILKEYPAAQIRVRSYARGEPAGGAESAAARSEQIRSLLIQNGVAENQVRAESGPQTRPASPETANGEIWTELIVESSSS